MERTEDQKVYFLDTQMVLKASDIDEARSMGEAIIGEMTRPSERLGQEGVTRDSLTFLTGSVTRAREDKPVEFVQFGSDRPYSNMLALHGESEYEGAPGGRSPSAA